MAEEIPARTFSPSGWPRRKPMPAVMAIRPVATTSRMRTRRSSSRCSGMRRRSREVSEPAIEPELGGAADRHHDCFARGRRPRSCRSRRWRGGSRAALQQDRARTRARLGNRLAGQHAAVEQQPLGAQSSARRPGRRRPPGAGRRRREPARARRIIRRPRRGARGRWVLKRRAAPRGRARRGTR